MNIRKNAGEGMVWALTELGFEKAHVRAKFEVTNKQYGIYRKQVPQAWVDNGYVQEVPKVVNS